MPRAADYGATRQPHVQPEATGGWGGSAAGAADFLSRLARAEMCDASSLKGPNLKGPKVRQHPPRWTSVRVTGEAEITLAEGERLSSSSRRSSSTSPAAVACPSLATTASPNAKPVPADSGTPRRSWRWPVSPPLRRPTSASGWVGAISPPWRRSLPAAAVAEAHSEPSSSPPLRAAASRGSI